MKFHLAPFAGINPKAGAENAPQTAENCDVTSGSLVPMQLKGGLHKLHDANGNLVPQLGADEIVAIKKPVAPARTANARDEERYICHPDVFLSLTAYAHREVYDTRNNDYYVNSHAFSQDRGYLIKRAIVRTGTGFVFKGTFAGGASFYIPAGTINNFFGPIFQLTLAANVPAGGPATTYVAPETPGPGMPKLPALAVPLIYRVGGQDIVYAYLRAVDYRGPDWNDSGVTYDIATDYHLKGTNANAGLGSGEFEIEFVLDWMRPWGEQRKYFFKQQYMDSKGRLGPESDASSLVTVNPGEKLVIRLAYESGYKTRLYRSEGASGYQTIGDFEKSDGNWEDNGALAIPGFPLEPNGNHMEIQSSSANLTDFKGRYLHPANFAVGYYFPENGILRLSRSKTYEWHSFPPEYFLDFRSSSAGRVAMAGDSIIVFTQESSSPVEGEVFSVSGSNPASGSYNSIAKDKPLLNEGSLCSLGNTLFYVTHDGVAATSGGEVRIITGDLFTRGQWWDFWGGDENDLKAIHAFTADGSLFLYNNVSEASATIKLRLDLEEGTATKATTWTGLATASGKKMTFKSRKYRFERRTMVETLRLVAAPGATADVTVIVDGVSLTKRTLTAGQFYTLADATYGTQFEFQIEASAAVHDLEVMTREVIDFIGDTLRLTDDMVSDWGNVWIRFPDYNAPCAGYLQARGAANFVVGFYRADGTELTTTTVAAGGAPFQTKGLPRQTLMRVSVTTSGDVDRNLAPNPIESLTLFIRRAVPVSGPIRMVHDGGIPRWWYERYIGNFIPKSIYVAATQEVTWEAWYNADHDGEATPDETLTFTTNHENTVAQTKRLSRTVACSSMIFDFKDEKDRHVREIRITPADIQEIGDNPVGFGLGSTLWRFPDRGTFGALNLTGVQFSSGTSLTLYRDGVQYWTSPAWAIGRNLFMLPRSLRTEGAIFESFLSADPDDGMTGGVIFPLRTVAGSPQGIDLTNIEPGMNPWFFTDWTWTDPVDIVSGQVFASDYSGLMLNVYADGATSATTTVNISDHGEFVISGLSQIKRLAFDFGGTNDHRVTGLRLNTREHIVVPLDGLAIPRAMGRKAWRNMKVSFPTSGVWSVVRIHASGPVTLRVNESDGTPYLTQTITSSRDVALSRELLGGRDFYIDLDAGTGEVFEFYLMARVTQRLTRGIVRFTREGDLYTMLDRRVYSQTPINLSAIRVIADQYPVTVTIRNSHGAKVQQITLNDSGARRLSRFRPELRYAISAEAENAGAIIDEIALATSMSLL